MLPAFGKTKQPKKGKSMSLLTTVKRPKKTEWKYKGYKYHLLTTGELIVGMGAKSHSEMKKLIDKINQ
jgi:hypothetical protein